MTCCNRRKRTQRRWGLPSVYSRIAVRDLGVYQIRSQHNPSESAERFSQHSDFPICTGSAKPRAKTRTKCVFSSSARLSGLAAYAASASRGRDLSDSNKPFDFRINNSARFKSTAKIKNAGQSSMVVEVLRPP